MKLTYRCLKNLSGDSLKIKNLNYYSKPSYKQNEINEL